MQNADRQTGMVTRRGRRVFGGPYRQAVCLEDSYLLAASLYVHLNPAKARFVSDPLEYRWSSSRLYVDDEAQRSFVDPDFILAHLAKMLLIAKDNIVSCCNRGVVLR